MLRDGGSGRLAALEKAVKSLGGRVESFHFASHTFGEVDALVVVDLPDHITAAAMSLAGHQSGLAQIKMTAILTPQEMDQATRKSGEYRPPGR